ncbi:MAG: acyloxyacyl hydrolase [Prevotella sp.]|nr:acyloxyacyl hydrolase [Prevotella sp.]
MRKYLLFLLLLMYAYPSFSDLPEMTTDMCVSENTETQEGNDKDSVSSGRMGAHLSYNPGFLIPIDRYSKKYIKKTCSQTYSISLDLSPLPSDSNAVAHDYMYPWFSIGLCYTDNSRVRLHRDADPDWGLLRPVDYDSRLGDIYTLYGSFNRPLSRTRRWMTAYTLGCGIAYSHHKYDKGLYIDNELIGSRWLIYFVAGANITYRFSRQWGIRAGIDFTHHSNSALNMPNKGANVVSPSLSLVYMPYYESVAAGDNWQPPAFDKYWYLNFTAAFGGKALPEDWQKTQFNTPPDDPDYRKTHFTHYGVPLFSADVMYRYARRWASGIGVDVSYGSYMDKIERMDEADGKQMRHSPWSVGIGGKHEVFYNNLSVAMSLGFYLYRHAGYKAKELEQPYYETIGIKYHFQCLNGLALGYSVKAHLTKADLMALTLSYPIRL